MAEVTCSGHSVLSLYLDMPLRGPWTATVELDDGVVPSSPVQLAVDGLSGAVALFRGSVAYGTGWQDRARLEVVGGAGRLAEVLPRQGYAASPSPVTAELIATDLVADTGEVFAAGILDMLETRVVDRWARIEGTRGPGLTRLAAKFGMGWRVLDSGEIWVGVESWPVVTEQPFVVDPGDDGVARVLHVAPDGATIRPGTVVLGYQVHRVVYVVTPGAMRAQLHYLSSPVDVAA